MTITVEPEIKVGRSRFEELLDYKRTVAEFYTRLRRSNLSEVEKCAHFRQSRDRLFGTHPQSALPAEQRANFKGLDYYPYDPAWRFVLPVDTNVEPEIIEIQLCLQSLLRLQSSLELPPGPLGKPVVSIYSCGRKEILGLVDCQRENF